jgi:hypothetical protein
MESKDLRRSKNIHVGQDTAGGSSWVSSQGSTRSLSVSNDIEPASQNLSLTSLAPDPETKLGLPTTSGPSTLPALDESAPYDPEGAPDVTHQYRAPSGSTSLLLFDTYLELRGHSGGMTPTSINVAIGRDAGTGGTFTWSTDTTYRTTAARSLYRPRCVRGAGSASLREASA